VPKHKGLADQDNEHPVLKIKPAQKHEPISLIGDVTIPLLPLLGSNPAVDGGDYSFEVIPCHTLQERRNVILAYFVSSSMQDPQCRENYPASIVLVSNLVSFIIYGIGAAILSGFGLVWVIIYILFILLLEFRVMRGHCVDCYYYGKTCAFGKGRVSRIFFPRGRAEQFSQKKITWKDIVPDFLVFIIPVLAGILLLIQEFTWLVFGLIIVLLILGFPGNALVRGHLACRYCRQREIGCPAAQLFDATKKA
jgi:hypothetical protein